MDWGQIGPANSSRPESAVHGCVLTLVCSQEPPYRAALSGVEVSGALHCAALSGVEMSDVEMSDVEMPRQSSLLKMFCEIALSPQAGTQGYPLRYLESRPAGP